MQKLGLVAILFLGVGLTTFSLTGIHETSPGDYEYTPIAGHVTVVHKNAEGEILDYREYDNIIVNEGLNCLTETLFATTNAVCSAASQTSQFNQIGLLGSNPPEVAEWIASTPAATPLSGGGLDPVTATTIVVITAGDGVMGTQGKTIAELQHTFTNTGGDGIVVGGAVIRNTAGDALFAAKAFIGGNIVLNNLDTLQITWDVQIGS